MAEPTKEKQKKGTLILVLLLLLGSIGFNAYQFMDKSETVVKYNTEIDTLMNARIAVERELASITMELEKFRGMSENLDMLLNQANTKIAEQEAKIRKLIASERNSGKLSASLKNELAQLKEMRSSYLDQIDNLIAENRELKEKNQQLNSEVTNLSEQKNVLQGKVNVASQLTAEYVKVTSYKKRNNGKFVESGIAKRTNKLETCFTILENKITVLGEKLVYLRIIAPNQKPLAGYSKITFNTADGQKVEATSNQKINYTGEKQDVCLNFENDERILESGTYVIEIYIEGSKVHQSNYVLK